MGVRAGLDIISNNGQLKKEGGKQEEGITHWKETVEGDVDLNLKMENRDVRKREKAKWKGEWFKKSGREDVKK